MREQASKNKLIGLLVLSAISLWSFTGILPNWPSNSMLKEALWAHKILTAAPYDFVVTGDSRVYRGLDIKAMEEEMPGMQGFNFGFSSAGLSSELLDEAVSKLSPQGKKILLIGVSPNAFLPSSLRNQHLNLWKNKDKKDLVIKQKLYPHLQAFHAPALSELYKLYQGEAYFERFDIAHGFVASRKVPASPDAAIEAYRQQFQRENYSQEAERNFLQKIIDLKSRGYTLYLLRVPVSASMHALEEEKFNFSARMKQVFGAHNFPYYEFEASQFETYDGSHLKESSAKTLSVWMAREVMR